MTKKVSDDEVVMISKLSEDGSKFYYNTKSYGISAKGSVTMKKKGQMVTETGDELTWIGGRDIGRGVWNYRSFWFWGHGQGFS